MDPDANLAEQRRIVAATHALLDAEMEIAEQTARLAQYGIRLAELVAALDGWIARGGFLPAAWRTPVDP
jgi:hypothetical protein